MTTAEDTPHFSAGYADEGLRTFAGGFKTHEELAVHGRKFEAFKDADPANLVSLPKEANPEQHMPLLRRLGAPEKGDDYKLGELKGAHPEFSKEAAGWMAEAGLQPWQANLIASKQIEWMTTTTAKQDADEKAATSREEAALKVEWGGEYDAKLEQGRRALRAYAKQAGMSNEETQALVDMQLEPRFGYSGVMKLFNFFGGLIKESDFIEGGAGKAERKDAWRDAYAEDHKAQPSA